jgi:hypothetical protein
LPVWLLPCCVTMAFGVADQEGVDCDSDILLPSWAVLGTPSKLCYHQLFPQLRQTSNHHHLHPPRRVMVSRWHCENDDQPSRYSAGLLRCSQRDSLFRGILRYSIADMVTNGSSSGHAIVPSLAISVCMLASLSSHGRRGTHGPHIPPHPHQNSTRSCTQKRARGLPESLNFLNPDGYERARYWLHMPRPPYVRQLPYRAVRSKRSAHSTRSFTEASPALLLATDLSPDPLPQRTMGYSCSQQFSDPHALLY